MAGHATTLSRLTVLIVRCQSLLVLPFFLPDNRLWFPDVELADEDGLLALGGDLSVQRLLLAYRSGIFPWGEEEGIISWWSPDPRFVLFPADLKISKTVRSLRNKNAFTVTYNQDFNAVILHCQQIERPGQDGTWISEPFVQAYCKLHELGYAHSVEVWDSKDLVGGLYGLRLGNCFFGESMFSRVSNASRFGFTAMVEKLQQDGVVLIDCQVYTPYLESMGANMISREKFKQIIGNN